MLDKIKNIEFKNKDENWVGKILQKRKKTPIIVITVFLIFLILVNALSAYLSYNEEFEKNVTLEEKILKAQSEIKRFKKLQQSQEQQIDILDGLSVDDAQPKEIIKRVCDLLKLREVMGSYYVKRSQNKKFANVLNIEIEVSYGDKDLLFLVMKIVSEQLFYMKTIKQTPKGVVIELYKPKS